MGQATLTFCCLVFKVKPQHEMEQAERFGCARQELVGLVGCGGGHQAAGQLGHTWFSPFVLSPATAAPDAPMAAGGATYGRLKGKDASLQNFLCEISGEWG